MSKIILKCNLGCEPKSWVEFCLPIRDSFFLVRPHKSWNGRGMIPKPDRTIDAGCDKDAENKTGWSQDVIWSSRWHNWTGRRLWTHRSCFCWSAFSSLQVRDQKRFPKQKFSPGFGEFPY